MLYHWRVLPGRSPVAAEHADIGAAVARLGGSPAVRVRLEALAATRSLVLFCEYIPHSIPDWLRHNPADKAVALERQLAEIVTFLRDWELLPPQFDLTAAERHFTAQHVTHDADYASMRLVNWLVTDVCGVPGGHPVAHDEYIDQCAAGRVPEDVPPPRR